ncbi:MAG: hypothetical protein CMF73_04955 [Maricaulis sp.]|nr:hypothetical protein [Maricaulis sp.]
MHSDGMKHAEFSERAFERRFRPIITPMAMPFGLSGCVAMMVISASAWIEHSVLASAMIVRLGSAFGVGVIGRGFIMSVIGLLGHR